MRLNKRMRKKANTYRALSNKQRLKNQAKAIRQLYHTCRTSDIRLGYWKSIALEKQQLINEQARTIESLKSEMRDLELELTVKKPFWKRVLG